MRRLVYGRGGYHNEEGEVVTFYFQEMVPMDESPYYKMMNQGFRCIV